MTLYIAHRGMKAQWLENTLPAFEAAFEQADGMELDVQLARCGTPVVFHDDDLRRIFNRPGTIADYDADQLAEFEPIALDDFFGPYDGWSPSARERIPRLETVLRAVPEGFFVNVEIKAPHVRYRSATAATAALLREIPGNYIVSSFNPIELARFARLHTAPLAFLYEPSSNVVLRNGWPAPLLGIAGLRAIHPSWKLVSADLVERAHLRGWKVNVWTINDSARAEWLVSLGVDGIITDVPDVLQAVSRPEG